MSSQEKRMKYPAKTEYALSDGRFGRQIKFAVLSDLHCNKNTEIGETVRITEQSHPDYILMPGDIFERLDGKDTEEKEAGLELMRRLSAIAPVFYSIGNHENGGIGSWNKIKWRSGKSIPKQLDGAELERISECGAILLDDGYTVRDGIAFGGLSSGLINLQRAPDVSWLDEFCSLPYPRVLLCHHPEYYEKYLKDRSIELTVSGHAHGGQWRLFGRGVFAPGQGLFPKYTSGIYDGRLAVSRGLMPSCLPVPRLFNPPEVLIITC